MTPRKRSDPVFSAFRSSAVGGGLIVPGDRVLAALSGGADSVGLVALLLKLREEMPLEVRLAHFNHRLRREAGADEHFVRDLARRWDLPLAVGSADVRSFAAAKKLNLEEAGRELRYAFLRRTAASAGATRIATGHTMTDQAETVLMRLMRGAGIAGLAGIAPEVRGEPCPIVRPLLGVLGPDLRTWLAAEGLPFREDASNLDRRFLRNRIRAELLPELARRYEPRIAAHLARLAAIAREEDELVGCFVGELADEFILRQGREVFLEGTAVDLLPPALARRVGREFLRQVLGDLRGVSFDDVAALVGLREGKELPLRKGLVLKRERGRIGRKAAAPRAAPYRLPWNGQGELAIPAAGLVLVGQRLGAGRGRRSFRADDAVEAAVDAAKLDFPLIVRNRRPGDLYRPLGAPGRKKLKDVLRERGVPVAERDRWPVIVSNGEIVWAPGLPVAERFKIGSRTRHVWSVRVVRRRRRP